MQTELRSSHRIQLSIDIVLYRILIALKLEVLMFNCSNNSWRNAWSILSQYFFNLIKLDWFSD